MSTLSAYLSTSGRPEEDYQKVDGSCQWINQRKQFQEWADPNSSSPREDVPGNEGKNKNPSVLWLRANPGTGKTYLPSYVISELQNLQLECAYYYFHEGSKTSRTLGDFLRSLAY